MVWLEEGERKRSRRGQQRPPLTASLGADRLGGRPAGSRVRARRPGPDFRRASESCGHCAEREARSSPPRDVSGSRTLSGGPRRAQPDRPSDPRALRELRSPRRAAGARWEQPLRAGRASLWPDPCSRFQKQAREQDVNCFSSAEKEARFPLAATAKCSEKASAWGNGLPYNDRNGRNIHISYTSEW